MTLSVARRMWELFETYHAVVYFSPRTKEIYEEAGLKGGWMGYFASRSAAMGPTTADVVTSTFYNFHPERVARAIPDAWGLASPERVLEARMRVADLALRELLGDQVAAEPIAMVAPVASQAVRACSIGGRPLFAAHAALEIPREPHLELWHAATCLREFRGDGHVNALVLHAIDGCEANVMMAAEGRFDAAVQRAFRGWSDDEWSAAEERLRDRELMDADGLTERGWAIRASIERQTDVLSSQPWEVLGPATTAHLASVMGDLDRLIIAGNGVTFPNPIGLQPPEGLSN